MLPIKFSFRASRNENILYTAERQPDGNYMLSWDSPGNGPTTMPYERREIELFTKEGSWTIEEIMIGIENNKQAIGLLRRD